MQGEAESAGIRWITAWVRGTCLAAFPAYADQYSVGHVDANMYDDGLPDHGRCSSGTHPSEAHHAAFTRILSCKLACEVGYQQEGSGRLSE